MAGFCKLEGGLQTPNLATCREKSPIVSGECLKYSRFWETAAGDRVRSALRGRPGSRVPVLSANAISIPLSWPMVRALKIARDEARASGSTSELIFPATSQAVRDDLPATGNTLRHAFKTLCSLDLKVDDTISSLLMGHALDGVSKKYISKIIITSGSALRSEQARISRRIVQLLGLSSLEFMAELAKPPLPAPPRERKPAKASRAAQARNLPRRECPRRGNPGARKQTRAVFRKKVPSRKEGS
jgi:hypothetical protein